MSRGGLCRRSIVAGLALGLALAAGAEERREQSVGVAPIRDDVDAPRDAALRAAVQDAAVRAALDLLPADFVPPGAGEGGPDEPGPDAWLAEHLGPDPFAYATRFRILEDRGARPAMFASDPAVESEYVVVAEVTLDADAIRARLETLGLVAAARPQGRQRVTLVVEGLRHYGPLAELRRLLLDDRRVRSADPVEFRRGRAVLAVDADRDAPGLVADLQRRAPEGLRIDVLDQDRDGATLRLESERNEPGDDTDGAGPRPRD